MLSRLGITNRLEFGELSAVPDTDGDDVRAEVHEVDCSLVRLSIGAQEERDRESGRKEPLVRS